MVTAELSVSVAGKGTSMGRFVRAAVEALRKNKRIRVVPGPMSTAIEGRLEDVFKAAETAHNAVLKLGAGRVGTLLKIDDRRDKPSTLKYKHEVVREI